MFSDCKCFGFLAILVLFPTPVIAGDISDTNQDDFCGNHTAELQVRSEQATADSFSNVIKSERSLRRVLEDVLTQAEAQVSRAEAPAKLCPDGCRAVRHPGFVVTTVPKERLRGYDNERHCAERKAQTEASPISTDKDFTSIEEFSNWFNDYSRGNGKDGQALYSQCDADCSPEYRTDIIQKAKGLGSKVHVVCGHARDKSDNSYLISLIARWDCVPVAEVKEVPNS